MEKLEYTLSDLVSFGNHLLSEKRREDFQSHTDLGSEDLEQRLMKVNDADIANWQDSILDSK